MRIDPETIHSGSPPPRPLPSFTTPVTTGAGASLNNEAEQGKETNLMQEWLKVHEEKLRELAAAVQTIAERMAKFDEGSAHSRLGDDRYLGLVARHRGDDRLI